VLDAPVAAYGGHLGGEQDLDCGVLLDPIAQVARRGLRDQVDLLVAQLREQRLASPARSISTTLYVADMDLGAG
jgi:hypothetical protein